MKLRELLMLFAFLIYLSMVNCRVYIRHTEGDENTDTFKDKNRFVSLDDLTVHERHKRVIVMTTLWVGSYVFKLWTALEEGCNFHPSICTEMDEIKRLQNVIEDLSEKYDVIYYANKEKYLNLKLSIRNNKYILHYINNSFLNVDNMGDSIKATMSNYQVEDDVVRNMFAQLNDTVALTNLINPLEFQLEQIYRYLQDERDSQIIGLIVQRAAEVYLDESALYIDRIVKNSGVPGLAVNDNSLVKSVLSNANLPAEKRTIWQPVRNYFGNIDQSFQNPEALNKYSIDNYEFEEGKIFALSIELLIDSVQYSIKAKKWQKVKDELVEARKIYEGYYEQVLAALEEVKNESRALEGYWAKEIGLFQDLVSNFINVSTAARERKAFFDVFGLIVQPVDTSGQFFITDFDFADQNDLQVKQQVVIDFLNANEQSLINLNDAFKVQEILVSETRYLSNEGKSIDFMYKSIRGIYKNFESAIINSYNSKLTEKHVVCSTSLVLPNEDEYDHYPIGEIRTAKCDIADDVFSKMQQQAEDERDNSILNTIVRDSVPVKKGISTILDLAKAGYASSGISRLVAYGADLTEQDVVCHIATIFSNTSTYNFYDLTQFRPDCSRVTTSEFTTMQGAVETIENGRTVVRFSMQFCSDADQCSCPSDLAAVTGLTIDQVNLLIEEYKQENKPECTYVQQDSQCSWQCIG